MKDRRILPILLALLSLAYVAHAEVVDFNFSTREVISGLGTSFVCGCGILAIGIVIAAKIFRPR